MGSADQLISFRTNLSLAAKRNAVLKFRLAVVHVDCSEARRCERNTSHRMGSTVVKRCMQVFQNRIRGCAAWHRESRFDPISSIDFRKIAMYLSGGGPCVS